MDMKSTRASYQFVLLSCSLLLCCQPVLSQWATTGTETYLSAAQNGVNIGTTTAPASVLTVRGDEAATPTGEVFRTYSNNSDTHWRMFKGLQAIQVGHIWAPNLGSEHWYIDAIPGDLVFQTATVDRGRFNRSLTQTVNGIAGVNVTGNFGVGEFGGTSAYSSPVARMHTDRGATTQIGFRTTMADGFMATRGTDLFYTGSLGGLRAGAVWSSLTSGSNPPGIYQFIYTGHNGSASIANSTNGLEMGRFQPNPNNNEGYFGLGDWINSGGLVPDEQLDLLKGTVKIRALIPGYQDNSLTNVLVANNDGKVHWRDIASFPGCTWTLQPGNNVATAYTGNTCPPVDANLVGIGITTPIGKLDVRKTQPTSGWLVERGLHVKLTAFNLADIGIDALSMGAVPSNIGVKGTAGNGEKNIGVQGTATATLQGMKVTGVLGKADGGLLLPRDDIKAVHGIATNNLTGGPGWAGYFEGDGFLSATMWQYSDSALKQNIEPLVGCLDLLAQVSPNSYTFNTDQYPALALAEGDQAGVMAPQLGDVIPHLVRDVTRAADYDSLGNEITPAMTFKAVNYMGLIPYLLGAVQELHQENVAMREELSACCATNDDGTRSIENTTIGYIDNTQRAPEISRQLGANELLVTPNPFTENPTISYRIGTGGRAQLRVTGASSRDMGVLFDVGTQAGQYSMVWNTEGMAPGLYLLTLTVDGKRVTEQAVKVE